MKQKNIKKNIDGISNISPERLIDELKKITSSNGFLKLFKDKESLELVEIIFPQLKNIKNFKKQNSYAAENILKIDFIFLIALLVIDGTDNADYFLYKFTGASLLCTKMAILVVRTWWRGSGPTTTSTLMTLARPC